MKSAIAELKNAHHAATKSFRRQQLHDGAAGCAPNGIGDADKGQQDEREGKRRRKSEQGKADSIEDRRHQENPSLVRSIPHGDKRLEPMTAPTPRADCMKPKPWAPTRNTSLAKIVSIA